VVIVGGGFGGLYTALALAGLRPGVPIVLIEPQPRFLFQPLLYELLSGELARWEIAPGYDTLLRGRGVVWLQDRVERIDTDQRSLQTRGGRQISYGRLVLAAGGRANSFGVPGVETHSQGFRSLSDVERLRELVSSLRQARRPLQRLAIVGAGPCGVELACKLADLLAGSAVVELIEQGSSLLPHARAFSREQALLALQRRDVRLRCHSRVTAVSAHHLDLRHTDEEGVMVDERLAVNGVIWTTGLRFEPPVITPPPQLDPQGRLLCENDLRLQGRQLEFALGDGALLPGEDPLPATAQVALQQAGHLAANLQRSRQDEELQPFHWQDLGEMMSLGIGEASLCGSGITLAGPAADHLRRLAYLTRLPGLPHQLRVAAGWLAGAGS
jgi:NADH dehydrogenase